MDSLIDILIDINTNYTSVMYARQQRKNSFPGTSMNFTFIILNSEVRVHGS